MQQLFVERKPSLNLVRKKASSLVSALEALGGWGVTF